VPGFSLEQVWQHSLTVAGVAKHIFQLERKEKAAADEAFTAGLLHDLGLIILASNLPNQYAEVIAQQKNKGCLRREAELDLLGSTHAEVGAYLLGLWGLPNSIVEAVAFHHRPFDCPEKRLDLLCVIHVGDALAHEMRPSDSMLKGAELDEAYVSEAGLADKLAAWRGLGSNLTAESTP
jgi:putative nucleotidyltransferase with HDIG domain